MKIAVNAAVAAVMIAAAGMPTAAQKPSPADIAKQMSGSWTINLSLSTAFSAGRGGRSRGGAHYSMSRTPLFQRGGRGGGGGGDTPASSADLTPAELAERNAMMQLRQIAPKVTIAATEETFSLQEGGTDQTCTANGKNTKISVNEVQVEFKCRWDKDKLRQEFATTRSKLIRTWGLDESGHLVLKAKLEGIGLNTPEATGVFDRAQQ